MYVRTITNSGGKAEVTAVNQTISQGQVENALPDTILSHTSRINKNY